MEFALERKVLTVEKVLITGAAGLLGTAVVAELRRQNVPIRALDRGPCPVEFRGEWIQQNLLSDKLLGYALDGVISLIHCATDPSNPKNDLKILDLLLAACRIQGVHFVYVSIAGIKDAASSSTYFRAKLSCEMRLAASGCAYTIVRATQLHSFIDALIRRLSFGPISLEPRLTFQPIDPRFVADFLVKAALSQPLGYTADLNGPERLSLEALVSLQLRRGRAKKLRVHIPAIGPLAAFEKLNMVDGMSGGRTWSEWSMARLSANCTK